MKVTTNPQTGRETLRVADTNGDMMELEAWTSAYGGSGMRFLSIAMTDDEGDEVARFFSRWQIRELLPHLQAFAEMGRLEVIDADG